jgi:hypothetical protein
MPEPILHPFADGVPGQGQERRAAVRYSCQLDSTCHPVPEGELICTARVVDISATGIGLLIDRPIEPETIMAIQLQKDDLSLSPTLLVEVRHARPRHDGDWLVGCVFGRELSEYELKALL